MELIPSPEAVAALAGLIVSTAWPESDDGAEAYFEQLGLLTTGPGVHDPQDAERCTGDLGVPGFPAVSALWSSYQGQFFGLNFFLYSGLHGKQMVRAAYRSLLDLLTSAYGEPFENNQDQRGNLASFWAVEGTSLEMYGHLDFSPVLQLGFGHMERNARYEARTTNARQRPEM